MFIRNVKFLISKYLLFKHHSENECEFSEVECSLRGCNERYQIRTMEHHLEVFSYQRKPCQYCQKMTRVSS